MVVEQPFVARNVRSALAIGRAQAVALLAATEAGIPACEYTPAHIKRMVADHGASSKEQVQEMVSIQLGLKEVPHPADAADALAVAICHAREVHLGNMIARQEGR
jgi:crossover junction endodeoxyribonuclease RuvC